MFTAELSLVLPPFIAEEEQEETETCQNRVMFCSKIYSFRQHNLSQSFRSDAAPIQIPVAVLDKDLCGY
jgi:hypothetical protein